MNETQIPNRNILPLSPIPQECGCLSISRWCGNPKSNQTISRSWVYLRFELTISPVTMKELIMWCRPALFRHHHVNMILASFFIGKNFCWFYENSWIKIACRTKTVFIPNFCFSQNYLYKKYLEFHLVGVKRTTTFIVMVYWKNLFYPYTVQIFQAFLVSNSLSCIFL